jgi:hypothetical protein
MAITINKPVEVEPTNDLHIRHAVCPKCFPKALYYGTNKKLRGLCGADITGICSWNAEKCVVCLDLFGKACNVCDYQPPSV